MNKWQKYQVLGVSFLVAGVGAIMLPVNVDAAKSAMEACLTGGSSKAECECEAALESGSESALQSFLKRYPNADTICNATASTGVVVDRDDTNPDGVNPGNSSGTSSGSSGTSSGSSGTSSGSSGTSSGSSGTSSGSSGTSSGSSSGLNNGHGNLDQGAPGNSESHNNAENSGNSGNGNSGSGGGGHSF
jgi:hypothetical protein